MVSWLVPCFVLLACSSENETDASADGGGAAGSGASTASASASASGVGGAGGAGDGGGGTGATGLTCAEACIEAFPEGMAAYGPLYLCVGCSECYDAADGATNSNCARPPDEPGVCDAPGTTRAACFTCAQKPDAACYDEVVACDAVPDCSGLVACFNECVNGE